MWNKIRGFFGVDSKAVQTSPNKTQIEPVIEPISPIEPTSEPIDFGTDIEIYDQSGNLVAHSKEINLNPSDLRTLFSTTSPDLIKDTQGQSINIKHLASDIFRGAAGTPGKTIEMVFDPKIREGLAQGVMELVPSTKGGVHAMARNVGNKRFTGHARFVETGKVRQLATGAFQLLSIAVAQSHLDDINRNLNEIKSLVQEIQQHLIAEESAKITGTLRYLEYLTHAMRNQENPASIPPEQRHMFEFIHRDVMMWIDKIGMDIGNLERKISQQGNEDNWGGTEETFNALNNHAQTAIRLQHQRAFLLQIIDLLNIGHTYIHPLQPLPTAPVLREQLQAGQRSLGSVCERLNEKAHALLSQAIFNKSSTLSERRETISNTAKIIRNEDSLLQMSFDKRTDNLLQQISELQRHKNGVRMALTFGQDGQVNQARLL